MAVAKRPAAPDVPFWHRTAPALLDTLDASPSGLSTAEADRRLACWGPNRVRPAAARGTLSLLLRQFRNPIGVLLLTTAIGSGIVGETTDALIILLILLGSGGLGFWQERGAARAVEELLARIRTLTMVRRDGRELEISLEEIVPGDIVVLNAGDLVPADCRLLEARNLSVDEASLTGESFPATKDPAPAPADAPVAGRSSALFMGTHVVAGTALALVVATGRQTMYGSLALALAAHPRESEFERGVRRFGYLLLEITLVLVLFIFALNFALGRPVLEVLLFTLALAVGLTPQLLPAIVSITLAHGARRMAQRSVIVRRLVAIEDFGGMTVLCTDKTGTLTEGVIRLQAALGPDGTPSDDVRRFGYLNAAFQSGFDNPIDTALRRELTYDTTSLRKLDEVPYDFARRRVSVQIGQSAGPALLITKGAVPEVLSVCTSVRDRTGTEIPLPPERERITQLADQLHRAGNRCLAVAVRPVGETKRVTRDDERGMTFLGLLAFSDVPKAGVRQVLEQLNALGVQVKMVTGDNRLVAERVAREVGLDSRRVLTGPDLAALSDTALRRRISEVAVFAEVDPNQKQRIIGAFREAGSGVGYLGDGINDAAALHAADVGISVDSAVDVTRQAASIVLLRKDLAVLAEGIREGRRAFANTLKYVFITTSANFGNMFSMAGASLMAAFLPLLPKQILLLNLLSDLPAMAIATDRLDPEMVAVPRRWDVRYIRDFMLTFGLVSSLFDYLTFGLLLLFTVPMMQFRTGWFLESLLTEVFVLLVIRTRKAFFRSRPSTPLLAASLVVAVGAIALPWFPGAELLGFEPLAPALLAGLLALTALLLVASEGAKRLFYARHPLTGRS